MRMIYFINSFLFYFIDDTVRVLRYEWNDKGNERPSGNAENMIEQFASKM